MVNNNKDYTQKEDAYKRNKRRTNTKYINSKYGPNYNYALKISKRTVQRYLKLLRFSVKIAQFAPPNRNTIGLRIYRVAWCKIIEDILNNDNVLIAFVDEASVTSCEGRVFGRAYARITPVINVFLVMECFIHSLTIHAKEHNMLSF